MKRVLCLAVVMLTLASGASAHEARPAYLELRQTAVDTFDVLWKVPARGENQRLGLYLELPAGTVNLTEPRAAIVNNAYSERWTVQRPGGLAGGTIQIAGLAATMTDVLVRFHPINGSAEQVLRLTPAQTSFVVEQEPARSLVAWTYLKLGAEHIFDGTDHLLFIFALILLIQGTRRLVMTITAFTIAHSLTLAGASLDVVRAPGTPVEAVITLSIVFVAAEIIHARQGRPGLTVRFPWIASFSFGLLHGFGFAGALDEVGLPQSAIVVALLFFNIGVEIGQLAFLLPVIIGIWWVRRVTALRRAAVAEWLWRFPPYAIGSLATFWLIQRVTSFG